jgi:hypothetical protein
MTRVIRLLGFLRVAQTHYDTGFDTKLDPLFKE